MGDRPLVATALVNLLGCLIMGWVAGSPPWAWDRHALFRPAFVVGFLGGLTTFSAFAAEAFFLVLAKNFAVAVLYLFLLPLACVLSAASGYLLSRVA